MRRSLLLCALVSLPAAADTLLVAAGNNKGRASDVSLRFAERDAEQLTGVLRGLGRVRPDDAILLRGEDAATFRRVVLEINARLRGRAAVSEDTLIVYYSGHADADGLHFGEDAIPFRELRAMIESSPARIRVLIVDACRSGGATRNKGAVSAERFVVTVEDTPSVEGLAIITSSAESEQSQESQALRGSFFTHHLVNALRGAADRDRDARVTLDEAYGYAHQETMRSTGRTLALQHPSYRYDLRGAGAVVLTKLVDAGDRAGALLLGEPGAYLLYDGDDQGAIAAEVSVPENGARLLLPPGRYLVQRRARSSYHELSIDLAAGKERDLTAESWREIRYAPLVRKGAEDLAQHAFAIAGVHGPLIDGQRLGPSAIAGYGLDLSWVTLAIAARLGTSSALSVDGAMETNQLELGLRVNGEHAFDFGATTLAVGASVEGILFRQSFVTTGAAPGRTSLGLGLGLLVAVER